MYVNDVFVADINELMRQLIDDGCFDHANKLYDLLQEHDMLLDEGDDE